MKSEKVAREAARMDLYGCGHSARCAPFASAIPTLRRDGTSRRSFCSDRRSISNRLVNEAPFNDDSQASEAMNIVERGRRGASRECRFLYSRDFACVEFREGEALPAEVLERGTYEK